MPLVWSSSWRTVMRLAFGTLVSHRASRSSSDSLPSSRSLQDHRGHERLGHAPDHERGVYLHRPHRYQPCTSCDPGPAFVRRRDRGRDAGHGLVQTRLVDHGLKPSAQLFVQTRLRGHRSTQDQRRSHGKRQRRDHRQHARDPRLTASHVPLTVVTVQRWSVRVAIPACRPVAPAPAPRVHMVVKSRDAMGAVPPFVDVGRARWSKCGLDGPGPDRACGILAILRAHDDAGGGVMGRTYQRGGRLLAAAAATS